MTNVMRLETDFVCLDGPCRSGHGGSAEIQKRLRPPRLSDVSGATSQADSCATDFICFVFNKMVDFILTSACRMGHLGHGSTPAGRPWHCRCFVFNNMVALILISACSTAILAVAQHERDACPTTDLCLVFNNIVAFIFISLVAQPSSPWPPNTGARCPKNPKRGRFIPVADRAKSGAAAPAVSGSDRSSRSIPCWPEPPPALLDPG